MGDTRIESGFLGISQDWQEKPVVKKEAPEKAILEEEPTAGADKTTPLKLELPELPDNDLEELSRKELSMGWRLLEQLQRIIPLLMKLEKNQMEMKREELTLMNDLLTSEVFKNNIIGAINLLGGGVAAVGSLAGGESVGRLLSSVVGSLATFTESAKTRDQKEFQLEQMNHQEIKELNQQFQRMKDKLEESLLRADQLMHLRV